MMTHNVAADSLPDGRTTPLSDKQGITPGTMALTEYVLIIHEVADYQKWKAVFDAAQTMRRNAGEIDYQLLRYDSHDRKIVHFSRWRSLDAARLFFESDELVRIRREAGVKAPEFLYLHQIERGTL